MKKGVAVLDKKGGVVYNKKVLVVCGLITVAICV